MRQFLWLLPFNALMAIALGMSLMQGQWRLAPFLFVMTIGVNFILLRGDSTGKPSGNGKAIRAISSLGYTFFLVAALNAVALVGGLNWTVIGGVLGPITIGCLLTLYARKIKSA